MRPIAGSNRLNTRCSVVCLSVGLNTLSCAKTGELIEVPFGVGIRVGPRNTGDLREHHPTVPTAPPMRLPIPNSNPKP